MRSLIVFLTLATTTFADPMGKPAETIKVPFTLMPTGHFIVSVKFNGKGPYKLIFDTGAPTMLVTNAVAKETGILDPKVPKPLFSPFGAAGNMTIKGFTLGSLQAENVPTTVMDHPTVKLFSDFFEKDHGKIEGIVGFPFFARYRMTVDYQAKELTFTPNGFQPPDVMEELMKSMTSGKGSKPTIVSAAGIWGMTVEKGEAGDGVTVQTVVADSAAATAGVKVGDRLLTIDGRWTDSLSDTYAAAAFVKPGTEAPVTITRNGKPQTLRLTPRRGG